MEAKRVECTCRTYGLGSKYWSLTCTKHTTVAQAKALMKPLYCPRSAKKDFVMKSLRRSERGLLSYRRFSKAELQSFIEGRGLQANVHSRTTKRDMIAFLEESDDTATFDRFMDLPPELRVEIYELHFKSLRPVADPMQPPLTLVSSLIREESLPIFYQSAQFQFAIEHHVHPITRLTPVAGRFLTRLTDDHLFRVTRTRIGFLGLWGWDIDLSSSDGRRHAQRQSPFEPLWQWGFEVQAAEDRVKEIATNMSNRSDSSGLHRADIVAIPEAIRL